MKQTLTESLTHMRMVIGEFLLVALPLPVGKSDSFNKK